MRVLGAKCGKGGAILTPNELVLTFRSSYVYANFGESRSRNATVRVLADGQTHTHTHWQKQMIFSERSRSRSLYVVVRPSVVCLSVCRLSVCNVRAPYKGDWNFCQCFYIIRKIIYPSFLRRRMVGGGDPF